MQRLTIQQNLDNCDFIVKKNDLEYCLMDCLGKDRVFLHTQKKYLLTIEEQYKFNQYVDKNTIQYFLYRDFPDDLNKPKLTETPKQFTIKEIVEATKRVDPEIWK